MTNIFREFRFRNARLISALSLMSASFTSLFAILTITSLRLPTARWTPRLLAIKHSIGLSRDQEDSTAICRTGPVSGRDELEKRAGIVLKLLEEQPQHHQRSQFNTPTSLSFDQRTR